MSTSELLNEALSLPLEQRVLLADALLKSLSAPEPATDAQWAREAKLRLEELREGKVHPVPSEEVFARIRDRLAR